MTTDQSFGATGVATFTGGIWLALQAIRDGAPPWSVVPPLIISLAGLISATASLVKVLRETAPPVVPKAPPCPIRTRFEPLDNR
jgi:hypothetical protein